MKRLACALLVLCACGDDDETDAGVDVGVDVPVLEDAGDPPDGGPLFDGGMPMHPRFDCTLAVDAPEARWSAPIGRASALGAVSGRLAVAHDDGLTLFTIGEGPLSASETFGRGSGQLEVAGARGLATRGDTLWIGDAGNARIQVWRVAETTTFVRTLQGADTELGRLPELGAIALDSLGQLFATDTMRNDLRVFGADGELQVRELWGDARYASSGGDLGGPRALAIDHVRNRVYVADVDRIVVFRYTDGAHVASLDHPGVRGLALDRHGFLFASDDGRSVRVFEPDTLRDVHDFPSGATVGGPLAIVESDAGEHFLAVADATQVLGLSLADVHARACIEQLRVSVPTLLTGAAQSLRVELIRADGEHDVLGFRQPGRVVVTETDGTPITESAFTLYNGMGSAPFRIDFEGDVRVRVEVAGHAWTEMRTVSAAAPVAMTGTLTELAWSGTVQLSGTAIVPSGETLTIAAGTNVILEPGAVLQVDGDLRAEGTDAQPIAIFGSDPDDTWSQIHHRGTDSTYVYRNVFVRGGGNHEDAWTYRRWKHCCPPILYFEAGDVTLERVVIGDSPNKSLMISDGSIVMRECAVNRVGMGPEFELPSTTIEDLWVTEVRGVDDNDAIYFWKVGQCCGVPTDVCTAPCGGPYPQTEVIVRGLVLADADDDGVDTQFSWDFVGPMTHPASPDLRDVIVYGIADKGMSLAGGNTVITNALIFDNGNLGIKTDDNNPLREDHPDVSTIVRNSTIADNPNYGVFLGVQGASMFSDGSHITVSIEDGVLWNNGTAVETVFREQEISIERTVNPMPIGSIGVDNLTSDPRFIDPARQEYRLNPRSPAATLAEDGRPAGFRGF